MTKDRNFKKFDTLTLTKGSLFGVTYIDGVLAHPEIKISDKEDFIEYGFQFSNASIIRPAIFRYLGNSVFEEITTHTKFVQQSGIFGAELDTSKRLKADLKVFQENCDTLSANPIVIKLSNALELNNEFKKYYAEKMFHKDKDNLENSSQAESLIPDFVKEASDNFNSELNEEIEKSIKEMYDIALVDNLIYTYKSSDENNK